VQQARHQRSADESFEKLDERLKHVNRTLHRGIGRLLFQAAA
jgi:hypothetical protein